ncbi:hypothetical protein EYV94_08410 [Puteibacter caeruleilacunae]|nr:hypothetical protein EYV94_08410 [Puteibacter caeruleilacunae]
MKQLPILMLALYLFSSFNHKALITSNFSIMKDGNSFNCDLILLYTSASPKLSMRPSGIKNLQYNVASWNAISGEDLLQQVKRNEEQHGDGFDDSILSSKTANRTANLFNAAQRITLSPVHTSQKGDTSIVKYNTNTYATVVAKVFEENNRVCFQIEMTPQKKGYLSVGFMNAPAQDISSTSEIWQPMIWQEKRFPSRSYMTLAYRCPIPSALATFNNTTYGIVAHPDEFPFDSLPCANNSRFGIAIRNAEGKVQPMLFAPVPGGIESLRSPGDTYQFKAILYADNGNCTDNYARIARELYDFKDYRKNDISTLNNTFENIIAYTKSNYSLFIDSLKGCGYSTDVPGAVKNVSSLNPLELALVTDDINMFKERAYPTMEYQLSRGKFLFSLDRKQKIQSPSRKLLGPVAPVSELTSLYNIFDQKMPFLADLASHAYQSSKIRNLNVKEKGDTWMNSMFMYKATQDKNYLQKAIAGADEYIKQRIETPQTDFSDPLSGGFFFWTGYASRWIYLLEMYELTNEQRYLDAAHQGARQYAMFCWMCPKIPEGSITVNEDGKAPLYYYLKSKGHKQMEAPQEDAPAWRLSEIGLTPESSGTCTGHRAIFMANYAPWMLRLSYYTNDLFLKDVAKAAIIGRYRNFPGYHINTARTTIYEKENYPLRPHKELSVNSFHYNHIMPMASMLLDYMVTDAFVKSKGEISFPSDFIEGYAYLQNKFYGHKKGNWYGKEVWLWMPEKLIQSSSVELNYIAARDDKNLYVALSNQSPETVKTNIRINKDLVICNKKSYAIINHRKHTIKDGIVNIQVPASEQVTITLKNVMPSIKIQDKLLATPSAWNNDFVKFVIGNAKAMMLRCGSLTSNLYVYLEDDDDQYSKITLHVRIKGKEQQYSDSAFPYEFTVPIDHERVEIKIAATTVSGELHESEWKELHK